MEKDENQNSTLPSARKMHLNDRPEQTPEQRQAQVESWVLDDLNKMQATLYMIRETPEVIALLAKKFIEKMDINATADMQEALAKQRDQVKAD